ncbi:MAG: T9SS type A sorting domain-containing protein [Bacteroidetes bacterium]|jgi:hypothetical protein|nr:T9SS type A sorting domain-containing protein [Bacteroidota bacterium]MBP7255471.1 T9SS type A sorting domain-containing protein [Chitinophagales bacterium]MBK7137818.1 T9SS type A sorting domain-containing protein [Bacteroidota bacterium]MBK7504698.1 T9SS type A sorting domain-containing protein [Bacteroidota bacterium]MBK7641040.1 T9SS type A sorting domain-containing protein [Bacteroidota bacterium]
MVKIFTRIICVFLFLFCLNLTTASEISFGKDLNTLVKVFPNPMSTEATVKIDQSVDLEGGKVSFLIYNIVGKEVFRVNIVRTKEIKIINENLLPGLYFFQLVDNGKILSTGRISVK